MKRNHWNRYMLYFIGKVVNITSKNEVLKSILILDIGIEDEIIFYQMDRGNGLRGFFKNVEVHVQETGEEAAFKVSQPTSQSKQDMRE